MSQLCLPGNWGVFLSTLHPVIPLPLSLSLSSFLPVIYLRLSSLRPFCHSQPLKDALLFIRNPPTRLCSFTRAPTSRLQFHRFFVIFFARSARASSLTDCPNYRLLQSTVSSPPLALFRRRMRSLRAFFEAWRSPELSILFLLLSSGVDCRVVAPRG